LNVQLQNQTAPYGTRNEKEREIVLKFIKQVSTRKIATAAELIKPNPQPADRLFFTRAGRLFILALS